MNKDPGQMKTLDITEEDILDALPALPTRAPLPQIKITDPATLGFPPMLAVEIAMQTAPVDQIFEGYGLNIVDFERLMGDPAFIQAIATAKEELKQEGMSFKIKAKLQAEELMKSPKKEDQMKGQEMMQAMSQIMEAMIKAIQQTGQSAKDAIQAAGH